MCGIIGYLGQVPPVKNLLNSFLVLSSRGYDSFGFVSKKVFKETNVSDEVFKKSLNKSILNNCFFRTYKMGNTWRS